MKIVVACDSFKDSLSSEEVNMALITGILSSVPNAEIVCLPLGDGGEGTVSVLQKYLGAEKYMCTVSDPLGRLIDATYGIVSSVNGKTALIEMAEASGIQLLKGEERNVMRTSSAGLGEMILHAYRKGCQNFIICIGGSATCDAGMGMLTALGYRFLSSEGKMLSPCGAALNEVYQIDDSQVDHDITDCKFTVICDVDNPLYGKEGAAYVYGPQKGASQEEVQTLDRGLRNFADIVKRTFGKDISSVSGGGAAGGVGAAFTAFFNSEMKSGTQSILDLVKFDSAIAGADLVITGEGRIDSQTLCGKLPYGICQHAKKAGVPVVAVAGCCESAEILLNNDFDGIFPILSRPVTLTEALNPETAKKNIRAVGASLGRLTQTLLNNKKP